MYRATSLDSCSCMWQGSHLLNLLTLFLCIGVSFWLHVNDTQTTMSRNWPSIYGNRGVENGDLAVPVNNTLLHHTSFVATDTQQRTACLYLFKSAIGYFFHSIKYRWRIATISAVEMCNSEDERESWIETFENFATI